jgi:hypothetical protein
MTRKNMPQVGQIVTYIKDEMDFNFSRPSTTFEVVNVDRDTGRVDLRAHDLDRAKEVLSITVKDKHGNDVQTYDFAWFEQTGLFGVNVGWDAWTKRVAYPALPIVMGTSVGFVDAPMTPVETTHPMCGVCTSRRL